MQQPMLMTKNRVHGYNGDDKKLSDKDKKLSDKDKIE